MDGLRIRHGSSTVIFAHSDLELRDVESEEKLKTLGGISEFPLKPNARTPGWFSVDFGIWKFSMNVCVDYDDPLVAELIRDALDQLIPDTKYTPATSASLQWSSYESITFETILKNPRTLCNSYIFRKALIRKHFLATTVQTWLAKHPESILAKAVPKTYLLECDYADYLDEALNESYELRDALGEGKSFILKPSMTDRGQGIRLFSTREELEGIFEEFDVDSEEEDGVMASQLRHFVVQEYISRPLLLQSVRPGRKFHIRASVVAFGAIKVWVWSEMLALFAGQMYDPSTSDMGAHLTNTCLQDGPNKDENVLRFWSLPLSEEVLQGVFTQICQITGEIFMAAAAGQQMHFQVPLRDPWLMRPCLTRLRYLEWTFWWMRMSTSIFSKSIRYVSVKCS